MHQAHPSSGALQRRFAIAVRDVLPAAIAFAMSSGLLFNGYNSALGKLVSCIVAAATVIVLVLRDPPSRRFWRRAMPVLVAFGAAILWACIASLLPKILPGARLPLPFAPDFFEIELLSLFACIAVLLSGALIARDDAAIDTVVDWLVLLMCGYLLLGLVLRQVDTDGVLDFWTVQRDGRFQGTLANANVAASVAGTCAILAAARLLALMREVGGQPIGTLVSFRVGLYCLAFLIALGTAFATASRFTSLLTLAIIALCALSILPRQGAGWRAFWAAIAIVTIAGILLLTQFSDLLFERMDALSAGLRLRGGMWAHYTDLVAGSPLVGYGLGSFPSVNTHFLTDPRFAQGSWAVNSAHNILLQLALNAGLPYLALILASAAMGVRQVERYHRGRWRANDLGTVGAIVLIVGCAMIDIVLDVPATVTLLLFLFGLLWGRTLYGPKVHVADAGGKPA